MISFLPPNTIIKEIREINMKNNIIFRSSLSRSLRFDDPFLISGSFDFLEVSIFTLIKSECPLGNTPTFYQSPETSLFPYSF